MLRHMKVEWHHDFDDEPVLLFSEIECGREIRKVEIYREGHATYADETHATDDTMLGEGLMPSVDEIAEQAEFTPVLIDQVEFDAAWERAVGSAP